jgi:hypothetical protein
VGFQPFGPVPKAKDPVQKKGPPLGKRASGKGETNSGYFFFLAFFFAAMVHSPLQGQ